VNVNVVHKELSMVFRHFTQASSYTFCGCLANAELRLRYISYVILSCLILISVINATDLAIFFSSITNQFFFFQFDPVCIVYVSF
jgi:hypothetical protein